MKKAILGILSVLVLGTGCIPNFTIGSPGPNADPGVYLKDFENGDGGTVCSFGLADFGTYPNTVTHDFTNLARCENDEVESLWLIDLPQGTLIELYDDSSCSTNDSATRIVLTTDITEYSVDDLEKPIDVSTSPVTVTILRGGNLTDRVSCIALRKPN